jgi:hypothetical protein
MGAVRVTERTRDGRFAQGVSGNPRGRPRGSLNKRTLLERALREGEDETVARVVIDAAIGGDVVRAQFLVGRLQPVRRGARIPFALPDDPTDLQAVYTEVLKLLAAGEISGEEACPIGRFLALQEAVPLYFPPYPPAEEADDEAPTDPDEEAAEEMPEQEAENVQDGAASAPASACAAAELADIAAAPSAEIDRAPPPSPSPACGGGQGGGTPPTDIEHGASPHPDLPPLSRKQACADATGEAELRRKHAGEGKPPAKRQRPRRTSSFAATVSGGRGCSAGASSSSIATRSGGAARS